MAFNFYHFLLSFLCTALVAAHGHVENVVINGVQYAGYNRTAHINNPDTPSVFGWAADNADDGFISDVTNPDIICHRNGSSAQSHVQVAAGDTLALEWNIWGSTHWGPVIDYLANCNGPCETVDKSSLKFFKIDGAGKVKNGSGTYPGLYADGVMYQGGDKLSWSLQIPSNIAPGNYVLRHEIIALHQAYDPSLGAQFYPQCFNLEITGSGSEQPEGVAGTALYKKSDPGISVDVRNGDLDYVVPGPPLINGAVSSIEQPSTKPTATATSSATPAGSAGHAISTGARATSFSTRVSSTSSAASPNQTPDEKVAQSLKSSGSCRFRL